MELSQFLGLPYFFTGHTREGLDCWGLIRLYYREKHKKELPPYSKVYQQYSLKSSLHDFTKDPDVPEFVLNLIPAFKKQIDDIIVLRVYHQSIHCGLYVKKDTMLHIDIDSDSHLVEIYPGSFWYNRIETYWRPRWI